MADRYQILTDELNNDPLGRGYAGMSDADVVDSLNTADRDNWVELLSAEVFEVTDRSEFIALSSGNKDRVDRIFSLGSAIPSKPGSNARAELIAVFGSTSVTIQNLASIANQPISRAQELGLGGWVTEGRVAQVRGS